MTTHLQRELEKRRHLVAVTEGLREVCPLFPHKARVTSIIVERRGHAGIAYITVLNKLDRQRVKSSSDAIVAWIHKYGIAAVSKVVVEVSTGFAYYAAKHHVAQLLGAEGMMARAASIGVLTTRLGEEYGPPFPKDARVANVHKGKLVIQTTTAAFGTRVRMDAQKILEKVHEIGLPTVSKIEVHVDPRGTHLFVKVAQEKTPRNNRVPSDATIARIEDFGATAADPDVAGAFERLSRSLRKRKSSSGEGAAG